MLYGAPYAAVRGNGASGESEDEGALAGSLQEVWGKWLTARLSGSARKRATASSRWKTDRKCSSITAPSMGQDSARSNRASASSSKSRRAPRDCRHRTLTADRERAEISRQKVGR